MTMATAVFDQLRWALAGSDTPWLIVTIASACQGLIGAFWAPQLNSLLILILLWKVQLGHFIAGFPAQL